jgi:hypothetical protein
VSRLVLLALLAAFVAAPLALGHGESHDALETQLVDAGAKLMLGSFEAPQPGPLVIVPHHDGALGCGDSTGAGYLVPLGEDAGVSFGTNATHVAATFDLPAGGFVAFAVDTRDASRALIIMREYAIARHRVTAIVTEGARDGQNRSGILGVPYELPTAPVAGHAGGPHPIEGGGIQIAYDEGRLPASGQICRAPGGEHVTVSFLRQDFPESLSPGMIVHAVALYDPKIPQFLPRPIDESTRVLQANLYLARANEDPEAIRSALDPSPEALDLLPLAALAVGLVWVGRR